MGFQGICRALYDHHVQPGQDSDPDAELAIKAGDLLYILEKDVDGNWWRARKKVSDQDEDEPEGLVPKNYVEEVQPTARARALYEYTRQTDEELSFPDEAELLVFDTSDPDWTLVGFDAEFGFVPSNYIELKEGQEDAPDAATAAAVAVVEPDPPALPARPAANISTPPQHPEHGSESPPPAPPRPEPDPPSRSAAATALAGVMQARDPAPRPERSSPEVDEPGVRGAAEPRAPTLDRVPAKWNPEPPSRGSSDRFRAEQPLPPRDPGPPSSDQSSNHRRASRPDEHAVRAPDPEVVPSPGKYHLYNINEMISVLGKKKKMPTTLGINMATRTILIEPERAQDGPSQKWSAEKLTHYSREGKHLFLELVRPSRSIDFHAGAKDTAEEIVNALAELAGIIRADRLHKTMMPDRHKKGEVLYTFIAQDVDEVTVTKGDSVIVLDDTKSEDWYTVRTLKTGQEGVVPRSYIELKGPLPPAAEAHLGHEAYSASPSNSAVLSSAKATVEQNRLEEKRLASEAVRNPKDSTQQGRGGGGGGSSHRDAGRQGGSSSQPRPPRSKPDPSRVRTWTDRSKSFSVEAQFLGVKDGKLNLHKANGVKIAVPVVKMSVEDLEHVERVTGMSFSATGNGEPRRPAKTQPSPEPAAAAPPPAAAATPGPGKPLGASVEQSRKPEYDWFQFFLSCEVAVGLCERYAQAFVRDSMDESVLSDVDAGVLRTLGLREGDIIKVMRVLDSKFGRTGKPETADGGGGLFSGPGGALRNNTRKGRPAPAVHTSSVVDPKAFSSTDSPEADPTAAAGGAGPAEPAQAGSGPGRSNPKTDPSRTGPGGGGGGRNGGGGFDDDAWDVKPPKEQPQQPQSQPAAAQQPKSHTPEETHKAAPPSQPISSTMQELSLLSAPLQPLRPTMTGEASAPAQQGVSQQQQPQPQQPPPITATPTGATPAFFTGMSQSQPAMNLPPSQPGIIGQVTGAPRSRPMAPQITGVQGALVPPPPPRPLSAPQSAQASLFSPPPLLPQMTGSFGSGFQSQVAPPGQSLHEMGQMRLQQQQQQQFPQMQLTSQPTGYGPLMSQSPFPQQMAMMTGAPQPQFQPAMLPQQTGFQTGQFPAPPPFQQMQPQPTGSINSYLPPALEPERTGASMFQPQQTGVSTGFNSGPGGSVGMPFQQPTQPLQPQQTGPPPPVRFGISADSSKSAQAAGRRANLSQATPDNPFGF